MSDLLARRSGAWFLLAVAAALCGCSTIGYYGQLAHGEYAMLAARRPIPRLIADPGTDEALRSHLQIAQQARAFASEQLHLPRNGSYTSYADLHRDYAMWN